MGFEYNGVHIAQDTFHIFPGLCAVDTAENVEAMFRALQEAWERFAAMASKQGVDMSWLKNVEQSDNEASIALKARRIHILSPRDGLTSVADKLPVELRVEAWAATF